MQQRIKELLTWPAIIVGCFAAIGTFIAFFGFDLQSPATRLENHIQIEQTYHRSLDSLAKETDEHLEGLLRGECLENPEENLRRQGIYLKCKELGAI